MILVTGAAGKTGTAVITALASRGETIRALIHTKDQEKLVRKSGAQEVIQGDLLNRDQTEEAVQNIKAIYHIPPNVHPWEFEIGENIIHASLKAGVEHFVYHSVLHPQLEAMPHHWLKMRVEEHLIESGLEFTILQPTAYMGNIFHQLKKIDDQWIYQVPYPVETQLCLVFLQDVAQVAAMVLTEEGHQGAVYELVGTPPLSQHQIAEVLTKQRGEFFQAKQIPLESWIQQARQFGLEEEKIDTLVKMFQHYQHHGLIGNTNILSWLLGRTPTTLAECILQDIWAPFQN
jgi:uncharacterized protein YbjT (DUF2867 family)